MPKPKFISMTSDAEAKELAKKYKLSESEEIKRNTKLWAKVTDEAPVQHETIEIGEIETEKMNLNEKSNLLHSVALSAEEDANKVEDERKRTALEEEKDRKKQAEEVDKDAIDLEHMQFSAKDLNSYSAITDQNADKTFKQKAPTESAKKEEALPQKKKNFYEEIYD